MVGNRFRVDVDIRDLEEARRTFQAMEKPPARLVTQAARRGATVVKKAVRSSGEVPVLTGLLRSAVKVIKLERSRKRGKKVYEVGFDPSYNGQFQRPIQNPGEAGGTSPKAYYPASMEYGFLTRSKGGGISYYPGFHFMADTGEAMRGTANAEMARKFIDAVEKEWTKRHGS